MEEMREEAERAVDEQAAAAIYGGSPEAAGEEPDVATLVAEAEERGYRRGLDEASATAMERPGMWQPVSADVGEDEMEGRGIRADPVSRFLARRRSSVWD